MLQKETRSVRFAAVGVIVGSVGMVALVALALLPLLRPTVNVYPSPREVVDTASTTLVNNLHATGSATIDGATVAHKLTNTGALNTTNTADGWVSLVTESASAFDFTAPPYGPVTLPTFSVNDATADASLSHCTGVNCAEVLGWPVCAYHGTGLNGADAACYDGPVIGDDSTWRTSVTTPSVTSTSVSDLTVAAGGFNNTVIGTAVGATRLPAATASTMLTVDASKNLTSYAGSTCGGGTFATGISAAGAVACGAAPAGFTSTATTGNLMSATSSTSAGDFAGATCPAGQVATGISGAGALTCISEATCATPSVTVTHQASPGTLNLSTEGTVDWVFAGTAVSGAFQGTASTNVRRKKFGGWLWGNGTNANGNNTNYQGTNTMQVSTTASDDMGNQAVTNSTASAGTGTASATGYGFNFRVDSRCSQLVTRFYISALASTVTLTAQLSASGTSATTTFVAVTQTDQEFIVTFTGGQVGDELIVSLTATVNGGSGNVQFAAATTNTI